MYLSWGFLVQKLPDENIDVTSSNTK